MDVPPMGQTEEHLRLLSMFQHIVAGLECMFVPFGTVLGVFTLLVVTKDEAKALFVPPATSRLPG